MKNSVFISEAFTSVINDYLKGKSHPEGITYNSFLVVVIRLLTLIYDELDILNPFYLNNEQALNDNLEKYGYSYNNICTFKRAFNHFYEKEKYKELLYTIKSPKPLITYYNFLMAKDVNEIENYFEKIVKENVYKKKEREKKKLNIDAYEILKYSLEDINKMDADQLDEVNKKVYNYFDINENAINKDYLLDKAVFDFNNPKPSFSTGNGYVDILLILSIVVTLGLVIFLLTIFVF